MRPARLAAAGALSLLVALAAVHLPVDPGPALAASLGDWDLPAFPADAPEPPPDFVAASVVLIDAESGQVLVERNADEPRPLASLTKVMCLRLVFEAIRAGRLDLEREVTVPEGVTAGLPAGATLMWLAPGDRVTIRQLLFGAAVGSGNDACVVLAQAVAGDVADFVADMNREAARLGLSTARFVDPHGISPGDQMSARDMATLARSYIESFPEALAFHSTRTYTYAGVTLWNQNGLLGSFEGADGLKTGHTTAAGFNLVGTAVRDGRRLIAVVMGVPDYVDGAWGLPYRDQATASLLEWGFDSYAGVRALSAGQPVGMLAVFKGSQREVGVAPLEDVTASVPVAAIGRVTLAYEFDQPFLVAPVSGGDVVGAAVLRLDGVELRRVPLAASEGVPMGGFWRRAWDTLRLLWAKLFPPESPRPPAAIAP